MGELSTERTRQQAMRLRARSARALRPCTLGKDLGLWEAIRGCKQGSDVMCFMFEKISGGCVVSRSSRRRSTGRTAN